MRLDMLPAYWRVELSDIDISQSVQEVSDISADLDLEEPVEFNVSTATLSIKKPYPNNLETNNTVKIYARKPPSTEEVIIFTGKIINIEQQLKGDRLIDVLVSDLSQQLRNEPLDDFGISKRVRVSKAGDTDSGEYPFTDILSPVSNGSLKDPVSGGERLELVDNFKTEGLLDPRHITYDESILRSENEALGVDPDVTIKTPYRYKSVKFIVEKILEHYGITEHDISVDNIDDIDSFSANGRVGYDVIGNLDASNPLTTEQDTTEFWNGAPTDFLIDGGKFYFLYSGRYDNIIDDFKYHLLLRGIISGSPTIGQVLRDSSDNYKLNANATEAAFFTSLGSGDKIILDPANKERVPFALRSPIVLILSSSPTYDSGSRTINISASQYNDNSALFSTIDYNVYAVETPENRPSIIEYDIATDSYREIYKRPNHAEWWKFVKSDDIFYILGTEKSSVEKNLPVLGAYDPTEAGSKTLIEKLDVSTGLLDTFVESRPSHILRPVVGMYYQMGFEQDGRNNNVRQGIQPDTRKSFILHNNYLYYIYANNTRCGIARANIDGSTPTAFVPILRDDYFNHLGIDFDIKDGYLYGGAVFKRETNSSRIIFRKAI